MKNRKVIEHPAENNQVEAARAAEEDRRKQNEIINRIFSAGCQLEFCQEALQHGTTHPGIDDVLGNIINHLSDTENALRELWDIWEGT